MNAADRKYTVYKHTSPSGKTYIGITSQTIMGRWGRCGNGYKTCLYFWSAICRHGWDNFQHEVLADGLTEAEAKQREKDLIAAYRTRDPKYGYNLTDGGDGLCGYHHSKEARAKLRAARIGKTWSAEDRKKMMGRQPMLGHKHSEATLAKMRDAAKGRTFSDAQQAASRATRKNMIISDATRAKLSAASKGNQYNLGRKASAATRAVLSAAAKGRIATEEAKKNMRAACKRRAKEIECLTIGGDRIERYLSLKEAAEITGITRSCICCACSGKQATAGGYKWRYV